MTVTPRSRWPTGISRLGIDAQDQLFWDGRRIEVRQTLTLSRVQKLFAAMAVASAIAGGLGGFVTGLNNASIFLCARGWPMAPSGVRVSV